MSLPEHPELGKRLRSHQGPRGMVHNMQRRGPWYRREWWVYLWDRQGPCGSWVPYAGCVPDDGGQP